MIGGGDVVALWWVYWCCMVLYSVNQGTAAREAAQDEIRSLTRSLLVHMRSVWYSQHTENNPVQKQNESHLKGDYDPYFRYHICYSSTVQYILILKLVYISHSGKLLSFWQHQYSSCTSCYYLLLPIVHIACLLTYHLLFFFIDALSVLAIHFAAVMLWISLVWWIKGYLILF